MADAESSYGITRDLLVADYWLVRTLHAWAAATLEGTVRVGYPDPGRPRADQVVGKLVFGGGTSLSSAWGITHRWSRDIDLVLDPAPEFNQKRLRQACKKAAQAAASLVDCTYKETERSAAHLFLAIRDRQSRSEVASIDIAFRSLHAPVWVQKMPVMSMLGRVCPSDVLDAFPELGGFGFDCLGPGSTAMNKLLAQAEMCATGDLDGIRERARDIYDLACIAHSRDLFEGHIGRDSRALLWVAESWVGEGGGKRPADGFASLRTFNPSTPEYEALATGYDTVVGEMVWGEAIPLGEAIDLALSLDPGPPMPVNPPEPHPQVAYPRISG